LAAPAPLFLHTTAALAAERPGERLLVVVQLSGGNDGLNTVIPYADENYRKLRPSLAIDRGSVLKIDNQWGLHPRLTGLSKLLENRQLAIVQSVGYPNPNRSHFESMDIWHSANSKPDRKTGWLGRSFDAQRSSLEASGDPPGLHLGAENQPLALAARDVHAPSVHSLSQFRLETGGDAGQRRAVEALTAAPRASAGDLLQFVQTRSTSALRVSGRLEAAVGNYRATAAYPATPLAAKLKQVAQFIDAGLGTRVYYVTLDGFDTHSNQAAAHGGLLDQLGGALAAFAEDLQSHGHLDRVATLVFSEFGRRVAENASRGTDHGAAAPVLLVGGRVHSGLIGAPPRLDDLQDGDLKFGIDFRCIYAAILERWLSWPSATILGSGFAPAEVFAT
jgi:uncharacterized protein (DUF1501 family)